MTAGNPKPALSRAELWDLANDMRDAESITKDPQERLAEYKEIRADLESRLAELEGRDLPEEHMRS